MIPQSPAKSDLVISYLALRKAIGYIGILMPFVVKLGAYWYERIPGNESISAYYYTGMRDVFVGALCSVGVFLFCYRSTDTQDNVLTNIAGLAAIGVGLLPMDALYSPVIEAKFPNMNSSTCYSNHGPLGFHFYAVATFFIIISYLAIFRFPRSTQAIITRQKRSRNKVYVVCGAVMLVSIASIAFIKNNSAANSIFWPETFAIVAFGLAWLTKGQAILKDQV